jgi:hypothetical protein
MNVVFRFSKDEQNTELGRRAPGASTPAPNNGRVGFMEIDPRNAPRRRLLLGPVEPHVAEREAAQRSGAANAADGAQQNTPGASSTSDSDSPGVLRASAHTGRKENRRAGPRSGDGGNADRASSLPRRTFREINALLEGAEALFAQGLSDRRIADDRGVRPEDVRGWRRRKQLRGKPGRPPTKPLRATNGAAQLSRAGRHAIRCTLGAKGLPSRLKRGELDHGLLGKLAFELFGDGWGIEQIAHATGIDEWDVLVAFDLDYGRRANTCPPRRPMGSRSPSAMPIVQVCDVGQWADGHHGAGDHRPD